MGRNNTNRTNKRNTISKNKKTTTSRKIHQRKLRLKIKRKRNGVYMNQKQLMEGSYIMAFFTNVGTLNNYYAQYQNLMLEIKFSCGDDKETLNKTGLTDDQRETIKNATQSLRIISTQVYLQYESLKGQITTTPEQDTKIQATYKAITEKYIIESESIKSYVIEFNKLLTNDILQDLFDKSQEIIDIKNGKQ